MNALNESLLIYKANFPIQGIYDTLGNGIFRHERLIPYLKWLWVFVLAISLISLLLQYKTKNSGWGKAVPYLGWLGFFLSCFLLNEPVDELFINLRHSIYWSRENFFSFNQLNAIEGIVDFLPYFLLGTLNKWGVPLVEAAFVMSALGGMAVILTLQSWTRCLPLSPFANRAWFLVFTLFPPLLFASGTGFSTTVFSACLLSSFYFLIIRKNVVLGPTLVALVPCIRLEGLWAIFLFCALWFRQETRLSLSKKLALFALCLTPLGVLSYFRWIQFGSFLPTPLGYKSSLGNVYFLKMGLINFFRDGLSCYTWLFTLFSLGVLLTKRKNLVPLEKITLLSPFVFILFVIPYYLSGGDWFACYWGRYLLPLSLTALLTATVLMKHLKPLYLVAMGLLAILPGLWVPMSAPELVKKISSWKAGRGSSRIQQLSQVGFHLKNTSSENQVVASSEVATIMFHADREALDFLGVANPEITNQPITGQTLFKKSNPSLLKKYLPSYLWVGDFLGIDLNLSSTREKVIAEVNRMHGTYEGWINYFYGGTNQILSLGYRPIFVIYSNGFSTMYFVSPRAWPLHQRLLKEKGFEAENSKALASITESPQR